jgi:hypothetical protein
MYVLLGPGLTSSAFYRPKIKNAPPPPGFPPQYAMEGSTTAAKPKAATSPTPVTTPSLTERLAANRKEMERLDKWSQALRLKKRDLLHSDVEGNIAYNAELAKYNEALAKATAERTALTAGK